MRTNAHA